jgi:putative acetyltransferase
MLQIRHEDVGDIDSIRELNQLAFEGDAEAAIVDGLRDHCNDLLSLVAVIDKRVVGHILFSPATIDTRQGQLHGMGLAPMAVHPEFQHQGVGSQLVEQGMAELRDRGVPFVIVLGHPDYYPRFGFEPASTYGIHCQWEGVPDEAFMVLLLDREIGDKLAGTAYYREEFTL